MAMPKDITPIITYIGVIIGNGEVSTYISSKALLMFIIMKGMIMIVEKTAPHN